MIFAIIAFLFEVGMAGLICVSTRGVHFRGHILSIDTTAKRNNVLFTNT